MTTGMAHELNQPLMGIRGLAEHLLISIDRGWELSQIKIRDKLKLIIEQSDRMTHIIEHIRMFAREAGKPELYSVQVNDVVRSSIDLLGTQFRNRGLELKCELSSDLPVVKANPFSLEEVILNLMTNARDAVEERKEKEPDYNTADIIVKTFLDSVNQPNRVAIQLHDQGIGIPREILCKIFEPFFTTKVSDKGTGLGLPISKSIVEELGGSIEIESEFGQGTVVSVFLPIAIQEDL
jgi:signal transduction histidine kinase